MNFGLESLSRDAMFNDEEVMKEILEISSDINVPSTGLESIESSNIGDHVAQILEKGKFESVPGGPRGPGGGGLEAIVKLTGRPALLVQNNTFVKSRLKSLNKRLEKNKTNIDKGIISVGRVELLNHPDYSYVGTAWMIEEDVMITNRHVVETFAGRQGEKFVIHSNPLGRAYKAQVDFGQEHETDNEFEVEILQILHIEQKTGLSPDMALVRVKKSDGLPPPIALISKKLKLNEFPDVAVIGYPARDTRNNAIVMDDIFKGIYQVKRLSPGKVSGVHPQGHILMHDCTTLGGNSGSVVLDMESGAALGLHFSGAFMDNNFAVTSPTILNRLSNLGVQVVVPDMGDSGDRFNEAAPKVADMKGRVGFDTVFLGDDYEVPLPELKPNLKKEVVPVASDDDDLLHYRNYSVMMHKKRRMAIYTAVNIDGSLLYRIPRKSDYWYYDPRIDKDFQLGKHFYKGTHLHKGHLVRRIDPAWGETRQEAKEAVEDTFFYTNSTPQHRNFNPKSWLNLEDYILENAAEENLKVSVFTGPVFSKTDKFFRETLMPEEYWKIVIVVNDINQSLSASGYIVSQRDFMNDLEFIYGDFKTFHVSIETIEKRTGLDFGLSQFDPLSSIESTPVRVIRGPEDIIV